MVQLVVRSYAEAVKQFQDSADRNLTFLSTQRRAWWARETAIRYILDGAIVIEGRGVKALFQ